MDDLKLIRDAVERAIKAGESGCFDGYAMKAQGDALDALARLEAAQPEAAKDNDAPVIAVERYADNGMRSHWDMVVKATGETLCSYPPEEAAQNARELADVALIRQFIEQAPTIYEGGAKGLACQAEKIHALDALARLASAREQGALEATQWHEAYGRALDDVATVKARADQAEAELADALRELGAALDRQGQARLAAESKVAELTRQAERNASWIQTISAERDEAERKVEEMRAVLIEVEGPLTQYVIQHPKWTPLNGVEQDPYGSHKALEMLRAIIATPAEGTRSKGGPCVKGLRTTCELCPNTDYCDVAPLLAAEGTTREGEAK
jgi:hypothetical protein